MGYNKKGHYGHYSGNAHHSKHHMVNSWEEEDVKRGRKLEREGHSGHAEALFDDAHDSYNWHPGMHTHAEHGPSRESSKRAERIRNRAMKRSERSGAEWGDYDYEDPKVQKLLDKANKVDERSGDIRPLSKPKALATSAGELGAQIIGTRALGKAGKAAAEADWQKVVNSKRTAGIGYETEYQTDKDGNTISGLRFEDGTFLPD